MAAAVKAGRAGPQRLAQAASAAAVVPLHRRL